MSAKNWLVSLVVPAALGPGAGAIGAALWAREGPGR